MPAFTLQTRDKTNDKRVKYSRMEKALFAGLPKSGKHTTTEKLVRSVYDRQHTPFHARTAVLVILRRLILKVAHNDEPFRVMRTEANGSQPIEVWLEPKRS